MKYILLIFVILLYSCNPMMHVTSAGMRHHNLSQNKYQPKKQRKPVKIGNSINSPFWFIFRKL